MRIAVVADIHGNARALRAVMEGTPEASVTSVICSA